jgi:hypothetical protein
VMSFIALKMLSWLLSRAIFDMMFPFSVRD